MQPAHFDQQQIREIAGILIQTRPDELTCDEWLDRVAVYAEAYLNDALPIADSARMEHHMMICPECREEFDALIAALRAASE